MEEIRRLEIPETNDVIVGELAERGDWVLANVDTNGSWPVATQKVSYRREIVWILPVMKKCFPAVAMKVPSGKDRVKCELFLMRFLSNLAWVKRQGFLVAGFGGGNVPRPMGRDKTFGYSICEEFNLSYFPEPESDSALLALALLREGRGLNHPGYAFLSCYRVLEVALRDGKERGEWISKKLDMITDHRALEAINKLKAQGVENIGEHLRDSGRHAIAHAKEKPIIDPDDPSDARRLRSELPIMDALAELAIEDILGVETSHTVWRKHLYELKGFKDILGPDIVDHLARGEQITEQHMIDIPNINVQLRRHGPYPSLSNLQVKEIGQNGSNFFMVFQLDDEALQIQFKLDFAEERLVFDLINDLSIEDDGTSESAEAIAEVKRFEKEYFGNGELHIYNAETGELISRKDAYIPLNMYVDHKAADKEIAYWKQTAKNRQEKDRR